MDPNLMQIAQLLSSEGASDAKIREVLQEATGNKPQRELTKEERDIFLGAVARAVSMMPSFRDAIALIRPFKDYTTPTLYTDKFSRVGIGEFFFLEELSSYRRASLLLHEAMHVLNNHFTREVNFTIDPDSDNFAKDLEINSILNRHPKVDLSKLLLPENDPFNFPDSKSYEQYAKMMKDKGLIPQEQNGEDGDGESQDGDSQPEGSSAGGSTAGSSSSSSSGSTQSELEDSDSDESSDSEMSPKNEDSEANDSNNFDGSGVSTNSEEWSADPGHSSCDRSSSEREKIADELGIDKASSSEQSVARNNTVARIQEEARKSKERGDKGALMMLQQMELAMQPSKVDWRVIFRNIVSNSLDAIILGRAEHTYKRINKRLNYGGFIFPGMIRYEPTVILGVDTSGSMTKKDYIVALSEIEAIVKKTMRNKRGFRAFCVDARATEPKVVTKIADLDLRGGGGTAMEVAIRSVELLPRKSLPDVFVLATDGGTSWPAFKRELERRKGKYKVVVLITSSFSYEYAKDQLSGIADVIDISND